MGTGTTEFNFCTASNSGFRNNFFRLAAHTSRPGMTSASERLAKDISTSSSFPPSLFETGHVLFPSVQSGLVKQSSVRLHVLLLIHMSPHHQQHGTPPHAMLVLRETSTAVQKWINLKVKNRLQRHADICGLCSVSMEMSRILQ